jgi:hypothetical protein
MHYDKNCDDNAGSVGKPWWVVTEEEPDTVATQDLDGDGECDFNAYTAQSTTSTTPLSGEWDVNCDDSVANFADHTLTLTPSCPTAPAYTYVWGEWSPQQTDGTSCGGQDQRNAMEGGCAALVGCGGCTNRQETTQTRNQAACVTTTTTTTTTTNVTATTVTATTATTAATSTPTSTGSTSTTSAVPTTTSAPSPTTTLSNDDVLAATTKRKSSSSATIAVPVTLAVLGLLVGVLCAFSDSNLHSRMALVPTPARLKLAGVCSMAFLSGVHSSYRFTL